jgi:hypothetical protein
MLISKILRNMNFELKLTKYIIRFFDATLLHSKSAHGVSTILPFGGVNIINLNSAPKPTLFKKE